MGHHAYAERSDDSSHVVLLILTDKVFSTTLRNTTMEFVMEIDDKLLENFLGKPQQEATIALQRRFPEMSIHAVQDDWGVTMDFRMDRIRVYYDGKTNLVSAVRQG